MTMDEIGASVEVNEIDLIEKDLPFEISRINPDSSKKKQSKEQKDELLNISNESAMQCRICWGTEADADYQSDFNPLISPCNCLGSVKAIHLKCLKEWLETKRSMKIHRG
jgi:hypothetical protein